MLKTVLFTSLICAGQILNAQIEPTPYVDKGPLYPDNTEEARDNDLVDHGDSNTEAKGEIIELRGTIVNTEGQKVSNAQVLIWQTDDNGYYEHPQAAEMMGRKTLELDPNFQYWGKTITDQNGNYFFKTIIPKPYLILGLQRPAHIHFEVKHPDYNYLTMELHYPNDIYLKDDQVTSHLDDDDHDLLMAKITIPPKGLGNKIVGFNIVLQEKQ